MLLLAVLSYLIPVAALLIARARADRPLWQVALDVPTAVAADLLLVLLLARAVPLELAALSSRPLEIMAAAGWLLRRRARRDSWAWPRALGPRAGLASLAASAACAAVSLSVSRSYHIWDRFWHISLVPAIRAQQLPFANVYEPTRPLSYHYTGDGLAAMLQTFSLGSIHSSHALSLAHDLMFGLSGASLGLLLMAWGARGISTATLGALSWVLAGPPSLLRDDDKQWAGYNFVHYLTLSFRPHASVAGLLLIGIVAALLGRSQGGGAEEARDDTGTAIPLVLLCGAMSITDEASTAVVGLALGAAWLAWPTILASSWKRGLLLLLGLLAAVLLANLVYSGLLSPGADRPETRLVPWRSPGFANPTLPFSSPNGAKYFLLDVAALLLFAIAALWAALRARRRQVLAVAAFVVVAVAVGVVGLGRLDIPPKAVEAHRFVTAPMLACPLVAMYWLLQRKERRRPVQSPFVLALLVLALTLPAVTTLAWLRSPGGTPFPKLSSFSTKEDLFATDCRTEVGARLGDRAEPTYVSQTVFYLYAGCRPTFLAGRSGGHKIKTSRPLHGLAALADLSRMVAPDADLPAICPATGGGDPICSRARLGGCDRLGSSRLGTEIVRCHLSPEDRQALGRKRR